MARKKRPDAGKRAVDSNGIVHAFGSHKGDYNTRLATTYCGLDLWEEGVDPIAGSGWRIVPKCMVTCVRCLGTRPSWLT